MKRGRSQRQSPNPHVENGGSWRSKRTNGNTSKVVGSRHEKQLRMENLIEQCGATGVFSSDTKETSETKQVAGRMAVAASPAQIQRRQLILEDSDDELVALTASHMHRNEKPSPVTKL
ncbi:unnamed protein product [Linum trigynum]|uniref:Uncharacterized protein n=1 Tax=Linum trigynum TaxID=586398 RepID=A0AAV2EDF1_9ROSI